MPSGNKNFGKQHGFKKGDPRINRHGAPKKLPKLKELMEQIVGHTDPSKLEKSELGLVVKAILKRAKKGDVRAAELIMDRTFGKALQSLNFKGDIAIPITGMKIVQPEQPKKK